MNAAAAGRAPAAAGSPGDLPTVTKVIAFATMCVGFFIALLDIQIVSASLRDIGGGLSAGADETAWVQTSYLIAEIVVIPLSGWLSRVMSTRWLFCVSAAGFTLTSLLCGWAWDIRSMIVFRALQGFLGGPMIPTVFTSAFIYFAGHQRVIAAATIGSIASLAPTLGPTIGGWITDNYSWHWLFFINLVPGIFVAVVVPILVRIDRPDLSLLRRADYLGHGTDGAGPGRPAIHPRGRAALGLVRRRHHPHDRLGRRSGRDRVPLAEPDPPRPGGRPAGAQDPELRARLPVLVRRRRRHLRHDLSDAPLFLGRVRGFSALQIGLAVLSTGVFQLAAIPVYTFLARRIDLRWLMMFGFACFTLSMWKFAPITHDWGWRELLLPQALRGFSQQFAVAPAVTLGLGSLAPERLKLASGLFNLMRNLGGAISIAACATILNDRANLHFLRLAEHLTTANPAVADLLQRVTASATAATGGDVQHGHAAALALLRALVWREAQTQTYADAFLVLMVCLAIATVMVPLMRKVLPPKTPPADAH